MSLEAGRGRTWRARSRAGVALVVLTAWFGALLVAAPLASTAQAAAGTPVITSGPPVSPDNDATPTWTFTLPPNPAPVEQPGTPDTSDARTSPSDTATATITVTHHGMCSVGTTAPGTTDYSNCTQPTAVANEYAYTATVTDGTHTFYVHDVETTSMTTTTYYADGSTSTRAGPDPTVDVPGTDVLSPPYTYDGTGPTLSFTSQPGSPGTTTTPRWAWATGGDAVLVTCAFSDGATTTTPTCDGSYQPTLTSDGSYTLTVTAKDGLGNPTVITSTYTLQAASAPGVTVVPAVASSTAPTWTITAPAATQPTQYAVTLVPPSGPARATETLTPDATTYGASYTPATALDADGSWRLDVIATVSGRPSAVGTSTYRLDRITPVVTITPASSSSASTSPTPGWAVSVTDASAYTVSCSISPATPAVNSDCTGLAAWTAAAQGSYTLTASAVDAAGNTGTATSTYVYDLPPGTPQILTPPTGNGATVTWTVTTEASASLSCTVAGPGSFSATSTGSAPDFTCPAGAGRDVIVSLPSGPGVDGDYVLSVTASDPGGSSTAISTPYVLDRTPPATPAVASGPTVSQNVAGVSWTFSAGGGTVTCSLVRKDSTATPAEALSSVACPSSPYATNLPSPGEWWLRVTVTDAASNSSSADSFHVRYDTSSPDAPTVTRTSPDPTRLPSTTWTLGTTEPIGSGYVFLCTWSGPSYSTTASICAANYTFDLPATNGTYTLSVVVRDAAGNRSLPTTGTVLFDDVAPTVTFVNPPTTPRNDASVTWSVVVDEPYATIECQLSKRTTGPDDVRQAWTSASCGPSVTRTLDAGDGTYFLQVRATDAAGNVAVAGTTSADVVLDRAAPGPPSVSGSRGYSQDPNASWTITPASGQTDPTITYLCRLVKNDDLTGTSWVNCDSDPQSPGVAFTTTLANDGRYRLDVVATDPAGNLSDPVVSSPPYTLDRLPPPAPAVSTTTYVSNDTAPIWTLTGEDSFARFTCTWTTTTSPVPAGMPTDGACASPYRATLPADGSYRLSVTQTDQAGNTSATATYKDYLLDTQAPGAPVVTSQPTGPANAKNVAYGFTAEIGSTIECRLTYVTGLVLGSPAPIGPGAWSPCTSPWSVTLDQGDGRYRAELRATDAAKNISATGLSGIYVLDTTGPLAPVFTGEPTGTANVKAATWTWTGETPSTGTCALSRTPPGSTTASTVATVACNGGSYATTLTYGDGTYQLAVQLTDQYGNPGAVALSTGYTLDTTAPVAPTISGPTGTGNKTTADYSLTFGVEANATAECLLFKDTVPLNTDFAGCSMPRSIDLPGDGSYVLQVRLTDRYGNVGAPGSSPAYLLDTKPPAVPVVTAPTSPSSNGAPVFTIVGDTDTTAQCILTRGAVTVAAVACGTSFTGALVGLTDGDYVLTVTATDPAGNTSVSVPASYTYDTTKPLAPVVTGPAGPSQNRNPVFSWAGESGATAECSLTEKVAGPTAWTPCATPYAPSLPADGTWVLSVRLTDAAKNLGDPGTSGAYVFDTTPPANPVVTAPTSPGRDLAPSWSASTEDGSTTECRLAGPGQFGDWAPCTLPAATPITTDGLYTFEVRATDAAGNVSQAGAGSYLLDTLAPMAPIVTQPTGPGRSRTPSIAFTTEIGSTGSCRLSHATTVVSAAAPCSSPAVLDLTGLNDGAYTLTVRAVDAAGNIGPAATATYVLDTTAPNAPTFTLVAGSPSSDHAPVFGFNAEAGTTLSCKLSSPTGTVRELGCSSPVTVDLSSSADGDYVFAVRATDPAGNTSASATTTYSLNGTAPAAPKVVGPPTPGSIRNPVWKISSASPAECRLTRGTTVVADWKPCATSYAADLFSQPDGAYILEARVVGTTAPTSSRYRLDTTGPAAPTLVAPPSPSTDRRPTWAVSSADTTVTAQCRVLVFAGVLRDWAPCAVSTAGSLYALDLAGMGDGTYSLVARLTDAAGNVGPVASSDYVLDTSAPAAVGVLAPLSPGNDTTPTWTLTSATGVKLECRLSSGQKVLTDFAPCAGTFTADLTGLLDGTYTLTVHALSAAGTPGPDTTSGYMLDTTAAVAPGTLTGPTGPSRDRAPRWTFTVAAGTTATCTVTFSGKLIRDGACTSPFALDLSNAADGTYTLTVRAVDAAGNIGSPSTATYVLKTTPPPAPTFNLQPGSPSSTTDPRWGFSLARGTTGQCRLLQAGNALEDWLACTSPTSALLSGKPDGRYTMQVRAIDVAGNTSSSVSSDYEFDRTAAVLAQFAATPATPGNDLTPTWVVAAPPATSPPGAALLRTSALLGTPQTECRLTTTRGAGGWSPCQGPYTAMTSGDGSYLLEVRAYDAAGTRGPATGSTYTLDTRAPAAPHFTDPVPPAVGNDAEVSWSWADEGNLVECHLLRNAVPVNGFVDCGQTYIAAFGRLGEATYTIEARATDLAGNTGPVATASYRYDITPPAAPTFSSRPPLRGTSASVGWAFPVPGDTRAVCIVSRNGTVLSEGACAGVFTLDLRGQQPATWTLSVHLVDSADNAGASTAGSYTLTTASGGVRDSLGGPGNSDSGSGTPSGPGGPGAPTGPGPADNAPILSGPGADPRPGGVLVRAVPEIVKKGVRDVARVAAGIPGALPGTDVPQAIKNVLGQTITKPQLPLALFVIVLLFLLVQNRIDRRDPKLAAAPMTAEPELTFGPILRPGNTLRPGGATA